VQLVSASDHTGIAALCRGLRTNIALKQLHVQFCNITADGGVHLAELLANARSNLDTLNITGNRIGGIGLKSLCKGLMVNAKLETLIMADNMIDQVCPCDSTTSNQTLYL
jgi:hypothetical protein